MAPEIFSAGAFVHIMHLITFRSRILVFIQWASQDLTLNRGARLITGVAPTDFNFDKEVSELRSAPKGKARATECAALIGKQRRNV